MLLSLTITEKSFGPKNLFTNIDFSIGENEKVALIGRNGIGKTTLLNILTGQDTDFTGDRIFRRGATIAATAQEYYASSLLTVIEYILQGLPDFTTLHTTLDNFTKITSPTSRQLREYSEALERFTAKNYYQIEDLVRQDLTKLQLDQYADRPFATLSGGQKRLVEVVKIMRSDADLALLDEPTNFMDYAVKASFISWLRSAPEAILVITHDRDVLSAVDRIIEIKDGTAISYKGNYSAYLAQNATKTTSGMNEYEVIQRRIENLKKQIAYARSKKSGWSGTADKRNPFVVIENRCLRELAELEKHERPSFWIDKSSASTLDYKHADRYAKYKAKNVKIGLKSGTASHRRTLLRAENLAIGYDDILFTDKSFELKESETLEIRGRNGAGKSTLIRALLGDPAVTIYDGTIFLDPNIKIGRYEQEIGSTLFPLTLHDAIEQIYYDKNLKINETKIRQLMSDYLFTSEDLATPVAALSGGQKARLEIIKMLAEDPSLLILDEPTSHLDLPSIEELESALSKYTGAILYISHDNHFRHHLPSPHITI